ncbi:MAG TPA: pilus assembly protein PilP [Nevskiaceae bacterium]|nr:pilus assembly protein PilP [Nevskiaceae bacterium]
MNRATRRLLSLALVLLLAACSAGMADLEQKVNDVKKQKSTAIEPIPQIKQYEAYAYDAAGRRDPFAAVEPKRNASGFDSNGLKPDLNRNKEPLEEFTLDSLRMVGIIESGGKTWAMVKAPDKVIHRVTLKDHMGQNYGEIVKITESEVSLMEIVPDGFGGWMQRPASLALAQ